MEFLSTSELTENQKAQLFELWNREYPATLNYASIQGLDDYLNGLTEATHVLILDESKSVKAWHVDFVREGEKWFAIIVDSDFHGQGLGTELLNRAKAKESELNGWVIDQDNDVKQNGDSYLSPLGFYLNNGFEQLKDKRLELQHLSAVLIRWDKH
ncbi:MAG TPA: N-acetyltransferase [Flavobacteriales bacterium]|nr:N-acetyltransferase [Flavobacteriales bacterium]